MDSIPHTLESQIYDLRLLRNTKMLRITGTSCNAVFTWISLPNSNRHMHLPRPLLVGPTPADFRLLPNPVVENVRAPRPVVMAEERNDDTTQPTARRRRYDGVGPSRAPTKPHVGGFGYDLDPWQEQLMEQMRAMQIQQQQVFERMQRVDDRTQQLYDHQVAMQRQQLKFQRQKEQYWMDLQHRQEEFFGRFPYPPPLPQ